jgi:HK97 family phage major capsid protein
MNWRIKKYNERKRELAAASTKILDVCAKDGDREPTEAESATLKANRTEIDALAAKVERESEIAKHLEESGQAPAAAAVSGFESEVPGAVVKYIARKKSQRISAAKAGFEIDPKRGFQSPRDFCMAVIAHGNQDVRTAEDPRLRFLAAAGSDEQGTYSDPYGGFLVPTGFHPELLMLSPENDPIGSRTTKVPMEVPRIEIPARTDKDHSSGSVTGGLTVTRRAETQSENASRMQMERVALVATSLFGLNYTTEELLADSPMSFAALLEKGFNDQFASRLVNERIFGTGVGEFEGVMNSPCLITASRDSGQKNGDKTITYTNIINMMARCWHYDKAVWLYNHDCLPQLMQLYFNPAGVTNALAVPVWQTSARDGEPDLLFGRPAIASEYCQTVGTTGDIILGNWAEYLEGTYEPMNSAESIHVRFVNHERTFKFWTRNAGRVWWRTALTPRRSTSTLSPFVALQTR